MELRVPTHLMYTTTCVGAPWVVAGCRSMRGFKIISTLIRLGAQSRASQSKYRYLPVGEWLASRAIPQYCFCTSSRLFQLLIMWTLSASLPSEVQALKQPRRHAIALWPSGCRRPKCRDVLPAPAGPSGVSCPKDSCSALRTTQLGYCRESVRSVGHGPDMVKALKSGFAFAGQLISAERSRSRSLACSALRHLNGH